MLEKRVIFIIICSFILSGCQKEPENNYLGHLHITHQLKGESTQIDQKEYEFFYGFSFERYLLEVQNILGEDNVSALPFQLDNDINSLKNQQCTIEGYTNQSWEDYFAKQALEYYKEINGLYNAIENDKKIITEDMKQDALKYYENIEDYCKKNNIEVNDYLHSIYGINVNKDFILQEYQKIALASQYSDKLISNPSKEEVENYYLKNQNLFDTITIRYLAFEKNEDNKKKIDSLIHKIHTEEDFKKFVLENTDESLQSYYQQSDLSLRQNLRQEDLPKYLQKPLFDHSMKTNEVIMYEGDNSYDVVMFIKREKPIYHQVNISTIYLDARESNYSSITDQQWNACKEFAYQLYKEIKSNKQLTLDIFHKYNQKYADYKENNGDYYGLSKGDSQKEIEQWIYDSKRKEGDITVLKTINGYSVIYFIGNGAKDYYANALAALQKIQYDQQIEKLKETIHVYI